MASQPRAPRPRGNRRVRQLRPSVLRLEPRVVPSFPGIAGITFDTSGDVFVSYDSTNEFSGQQQSVAEVGADGNLESTSVFGTTGASASPGALTTVGSSASLPSVSANEILELQPNGQLFVFDPVGGSSSQFDDLATDTANASKVFDVQTDTSVNLSSQISLSGATFGDFGVYNNSLVVAAEANDWDFVMRVTYGSSGGVATVLVASPASDGLSASPEGVAVDSTGTVLTTLPYVPAGSSTAIHVPVGFSLFYDTGGSPAPFVPMLGLTSVPNIDSGGITVDSQNNFIVTVTNTTIYKNEPSPPNTPVTGSPGIAHINSALTAFLADPVPDTSAILSGITYQNVGGTNYLAFTDGATDTYTISGELPLFSGQASPMQLRQAYGIDQIRFTGAGGTPVAGDGSGQTIAIVEEGVDPTLAADLTTFDQYFGIPAPPNFQIMDQNGATTENPNSIAEASLDVEWAHAVAPGASIIVYDSAYEPKNATASTENLLEAIQQASKLSGVSVVTLSYGLSEPDLAASGINQQSIDADFTTPGVTFLAASGDSGIYGDGSDGVGASAIAVDYPAASPNVVSVGGTSVVIDSAGDYPGTGTSGEVAWGTVIQTENGPVEEGAGGGLSDVEPEPAWQSGVVPTSLDPTDARAVPDVSMDSGAAQEYDVFTSTLSGSSDSASAVGWLGDAGTSAAAPIWAGLIAIADQGRALAGGTPLTGYTQTLPALYSLPAADFHDILYGNNGDAALGGENSDPAGPGYDLDSGLGTPVANLLVPALAGYEMASQMAIESSPPSTVAAGKSFGLTVQVEDSLGNPASGSTVKVALGKNPGDAILGGTVTATVVDGIATFSDLTLSQPGTGYTLTVTDSAIQGTLTTTSINVTPGSSTAILSLSNLSFAYDGSPHSALVTTSPTGLTGVTLTYTQNGVAVTNPTQAGDYTVTATLDNPAFTAPTVTGTLVIGQATPTLTWADPGNITVGDPLGAAQHDAVASFDGMPLPGVLTYSPPAGTVLPAGNGQTLMVSFTPTDETDFKMVTSSVAINVLPQSTPPPAMIISEQPVFKRKLNKNGKPTGKAVLTGFTLDFNIPLSAAAVSNRSDYELDTVTLKKVKKSLARDLHPIRSFTVTYTPATDSVTLKLAGTQSFPTGGQIKVLPGVTSNSGSVLVGTTVFKIAPGGKKIGPT
jgi:hypothetical protein